MRVVDETGEQAYVVIAVAGATINSVCRQGLLNLLPEILIDDRRVLAWIGLVLMHDLAAIDAVLQHVVERSPSQRLASIRSGRRAPCGAC